MEKQPKALLQWHGAFYAGIQIEFAEDAKNLLFENEHMLATKPMQIDILIIKKNTKKTIKKNIGRIFRKHNIIEYKSPDDYLSVDDFFKVLGYACFYKADTGKIDEIKAEDLTISYVCSRYPRKLIRYCKERLNLTVQRQEKGIYYIFGEHFPIQLLVTTELSEETNLWLKSLTNKLKDCASAEKLVREYEKHQKENLYTSVMETIVRANAQKFNEVRKMCNALMELMKDEFDALRAEVEATSMAEGRAAGMAIGMAEGSRQKVEELILKKIQKNKSIEQIANELETEVMEIFPIYQQLKEQTV